MLTKEAAIAGPPSPVDPARPLPATVVIVPSGHTRRTVRRPSTRTLPGSPVPSTTRNPPSGRAASEDGWNICAAVAGPPSPETPRRASGTHRPAAVETTPSALTRLTQSLSGSLNT